MALRVTFLSARAQVLTLCQLDPTPSYLPGLRCRVDANMAEQESATNLENMQESPLHLGIPWCIFTSNDCTPVTKHAGRRYCMHY